MQMLVLLLEQHVQCRTFTVFLHCGIAFLISVTDLNPSSTLHIIFIMHIKISLYDNTRIRILSVAIKVPNPGCVRARWGVHCLGTVMFTVLSFHHASWHLNLHDTFKATACCFNAKKKTKNKWAELSNNDRKCPTVQQIQLKCLLFFSSSSRCRKPPKESRSRTEARDFKPPPSLSVGKKTFSSAPDDDGGEET